MGNGPAVLRPEFNRLEKSLASDVRALLAHPLYAELRGLSEVRVLMRAHVFAVWDFMSLLKSLQGSLTCTTVPWTPPADIDLARFINEIVLGEETDEVEPGRPISHCELYLRAMRDVGADDSAFRAFLARLQAGEYAPRALAADPAIPPHARDFALFTLKTARAPVHRVAASFLYGREDVIPDMFRKIVAEVCAQRNRSLKNMELYLNRHIDVDSGSHGPLARRMLSSLCGSDAAKWREAETTAREAIRARLALWDGVLGDIRAGRRDGRASRPAPRAAAA
jgi:hypothetical protein